MDGKLSNVFLSNSFTRMIHNISVRKHISNNVFTVLDGLRSADVYYA